VPATAAAAENRRRRGGGREERLRGGGEDPRRRRAPAYDARRWRAPVAIRSYSTDCAAIVKSLLRWLLSAILDLLSPIVAWCRTVPLLSPGGPQRQRIEAGSCSPALGSGAMRPCGHRSGLIGIDQRHSLVTFSAPRCDSLRSVRNDLTFPRCRPRSRPAPPGAARSQPQHRWPLSTGLRALSHRVQERRSAVAARRRLATAVKEKAQVKRSFSTVIAEASRRRRSRGSRSLLVHIPAKSRRALAGYRRRCEADRSHPRPRRHFRCPLPGNRVGSQRCFALARKTAGRGAAPDPRRLAAPCAARRMAAPTPRDSTRPLRVGCQGIASRRPHRRGCPPSPS
jgi:hypothetical protein